MNLTEYICAVHFMYIAPLICLRVGVYVWVCIVKCVSIASQCVCVRSVCVCCSA